MSQTTQLPGSPGQTHPREAGNSKSTTSIIVNGVNYWIVDLYHCQLIVCLSIKWQVISLSHRLLPFSSPRWQRGQQQWHGSPLSDGRGRPQHGWRHDASPLPLPQGGQHPVGGAEGVQGGGSADERQSQRPRCDITPSHAFLMAWALSSYPSG